MTSEKAFLPTEVTNAEVVTANTGAGILQRESVAAAVELLRALGHVSRLMILCHLTAREHSVSELEALLQERQSAISQHLARLRADGLVTFRREGKTLYYSINDARTMSTITHLHKLFCSSSS